ncbi:hypothetical protein VCHA50P417_30225 [Vibrio chagasii]|nr:hypothetical protein VCHA35O142_10511 [Vibrio chagasii]CAH7237828.1 hypothetical protein VCHA50P417_30225 [Vibrio chagasii]CAH7269591.1 hypothetical protein VCHA48P442_30162 [Vibrio chagasii]
MYSIVSYVLILQMIFMDWNRRQVKSTVNKLFKRDSQRVAFLLCVGLGD